MSAAQSAHYLVDKDGKMHPADVWSLVESSKPKRVDRWEIPARWRVKYQPCFGFEGMTDWAVYAPGGLIPRERFRTWREALDYADRMARTREYVLPRLRPQGEVTVSAIWDYDSLVVHYTDASGQVVQGTPADLARHAATLLALAEQENE